MDFKTTDLVKIKSAGMTIDQAIQEWKSKKRRMGCVSASRWFCLLVPGFYPERLTRYTKSGEVFQHVVATDGTIRIDLTPSLDCPRE